MRERKPCDGTWQDYLRHRHHEEKACKASLKAWAQRQKGVRRRLKREKLEARAAVVAAAREAGTPNE